jgi:hypothetical protein
VKHAGPQQSVKIQLTAFPHEAVALTAFPCDSSIDIIVYQEKVSRGRAIEGPPLSSIMVDQAHAQLTG